MKLTMSFNTIVMAASILILWAVDSPAATARGFEVEPTLSPEPAAVEYEPVGPVTIDSEETGLRREIMPDERAVASGLFIRVHRPVGRSAAAFTVTEPAGVDRRRYPVRGGIPIFRGELADASNIRLTDEQGNQIPVQGMATAVWPEGTVKFLCIDFVTDIEADATRQFVLEYGTDVTPAVQTPLMVQEQGGEVRVETGELAVTFRRGEQFSSVVKVDGREVTRGPLTGRLLVSEGEPMAEPVEYPLIVDAVKVVEQGPVQVTVYLGGRYGDEQTRSELPQQQGFPRYVFHGFVRLYANSSRMEVIHSFGYNGDEYNDFVRRYGLTVPMAVDSSGRFIYGGDGGERRDVELGDLSLVQPGHDSWQLSGAHEASGRRIGGWASVRGPQDDETTAAVTMGLRDAWQQWPVSFVAAGNGDLTLDIYGGDEQTFLDLRYIEEGADVNWETGEGTHFSDSMYIGERLSDEYGMGTYRAMGLLKISELVIDFNPDADPAAVGNGKHSLLVPWAGKQRFAETRVFGLTGYWDRDNPEHQRAIDYYSLVLDFPYAAHEANELYGWVDWGDSPDFLRPQPGSDRFDTSRFGGGEGWTNGERIVMGYTGHYVASGWRRALELAHRLTLHNIGIDIEHNGGDQNTGQAHRHAQVHWASGGEQRQMSWRGWHYYYWLSGHPEVRRSLEELHPVIFAVHADEQAARAPQRPEFAPPGQPGGLPELGLPQDQDWAWLYTYRGMPYHYMNLLSWGTRGDGEFALMIDSLIESYARNLYAENDEGERAASPVIKVRLSDGELIDLEEQGIADGPDDPSQLHFSDYRFHTYGGICLISEWAQLTGSSRAVDALLLIGDFHASEARDDHRVDIRNSDEPGEASPWQMYTSLDGLAPAYWVLRHDEMPHRAERWRDGMMWRMLAHRGGSPRHLAEGAAPPDDPYTYTAQGYAATGVRTYGRNGPKIFGAVPMHNLYTLWFLRPEQSHIRAGSVSDR
jgi:hypothetical protein